MYTTTQYYDDACRSSLMVFMMGTISNTACDMMTRLLESHLSNNQLFFHYSCDIISRYMPAIAMQLCHFPNNDCLYAHIKVIEKCTNFYFGTEKFSSKF